MSQKAPISISQSLLELFATVRQQAEQYANVYEILLRKAYELDRLRASSYQEFDALKHSVQETQRALQAMVEEQLERMRSQHQHVEELYTQLSSIEQLSTRLAELEQRLAKRAIELDAVLLTIRHMVEKATAERFSALEDYVSSKLRTLEGDLSTLDSHIYATQEFFKKEVAELSEELARYIRKIPETRYIIDETNKYILSLLEEAEHRFQEKLSSYTTQLDERISQALSRLFGEANLAADLARANARTQQLLNRADALERKMSVSLLLSLTLGGIALIVALITILF